MNEQTVKLIEQLAQKLGTTTEYLWTILIKQAPISAAIDMIYCLLTIVGGLVLYRMHKVFSIEKHGTYKNETLYDARDGVGFCMVLAAIVWAIIFIVCFFSLNNIVNGFFNPEYWALKEIIHACN